MKTTAMIRPDAVVYLDGIVLLLVLRLPPPTRTRTKEKKKLIEEEKERMNENERWIIPFALLRCWMCLFLHLCVCIVLLALDSGCTEEDRRPCE